MGGNASKAGAGPSAAEAETEALARQLIDRVSDTPAEWTQVCKDLESNPSAVRRPKDRPFGLLHVAAKQDNFVPVARLIIEFRADPRDTTGETTPRTALDLATKPDLKSVLEQAARHFAGVASDEDTAHFALSIAKYVRHEATWNAVFELLRQKPEAAKRPATRPWSLLHFAAAQGRASVVETLVGEFGFDLLEPSGKMETVDGLAANRNHHELSKALKAAMAPSPYAPAKMLALPRRAGGAASKGAFSPLARSTPGIGTGSGRPAGQKFWLFLPHGGESNEWQAFGLDDQLALNQADLVRAAHATLGDGRTVSLTVGEEKIEGAADVRAFPVQWRWEKGEVPSEPGEWGDYPLKVNLQIEAAYIQHHTTVEVELINTTNPGATAEPYIIDLVSMRQVYKKNSYRSRRARREGAPLAVKLKHELWDPLTQTQVRWDSVPDYWQMDPSFFEGTSNRHELHPESPVFKKIQEWMTKSCRRGHTKRFGLVPGSGPVDGRITRDMQVMKVEVVQQPKLWRRYCVFRHRAQLKAADIKAHPGSKYLREDDKGLAIDCSSFADLGGLDLDINESMFWHGTGKDDKGEKDLLEIMVDTGNAPMSSMCDTDVEAVPLGLTGRFAKRTSMFGPGIYLADISTKANLYVPCPNCHQGAYFRAECKCTPEQVEAKGWYRMLLCRAVLAKPHIETAYEDEKFKKLANPAEDLGADSVMGEVQKGLAFREYIVYNDSSVYPEFIVTFKRIPGP